MSADRRTTFSLEYLVSVVAGLTAGYTIHRANPRANSVIKFFIAPLTVAYFMLTMLNTLVPWLNAYGERVRIYVENKTLSQINGLGYMEIFPPLFAILIVFMVLLYNGAMD
jgi:hypothetical protein